MPKAIGTSPKMVPGTRQPSVRSIPSNSLTTSILPAENRVERALSTFMNGEFSGTEMQIGGGVARDARVRQQRASRTAEWSGRRQSSAWLVRQRRHCGRRPRCYGHRDR